MEDDISSKVLKFADDTNVFRKVTNDTDRQSLQDDLYKLVQWSEKWQMLFNFGKTNVKCNLFKQYCCSYYGAPLWDLQSKSVGTICTAWRQALRKLWGLAPLTHSDVIALLSDSLPLLVIFINLFIKL